MDEKGCRQGISDCAKVICLYQDRRMTGKLATDGNQEMITVVEAISGGGKVLTPVTAHVRDLHYNKWQPMS